MQRFPLLALLTSTTVLLSACGGGGDSEGVPPATTYNAAAAWQNLLTTSTSYAVSGVASNGTSFQISFGIAPASGEAFPVTGVGANRNIINATISSNGVALATTATETFFDDSFLQVGTRSTGEGEPTTCEVGVSAALPSTAATIGASGSLSVRNVLDGCEPESSVVSTITETWSIEFHDGRAYFCTGATEQDTATPPNISTEKDCVEIAEDGSLGTRARVTLTDSGVTLLATN